VSCFGRNDGLLRGWRRQRQVRDGPGGFATDRKCTMDGAPGLWGRRKRESMAVYAATDAESSKNAAVLCSYYSRNRMKHSTSS